jgi:spermidine/putrescine transport system permease protein
MKNVDIKKYPGFRAMSLLCLFILYAPMLVISVYSFNSLRSITNWGGFTFDWYVKAFNNPNIQIATLNSLVIATIAALISTAIAVSAGSKGKHPLLASSTCP